MPLVAATDDDAFVAEISQEMDDQNRRNREHNAAMIEEYLRRRVQAAEERLRVELEAQSSRLEDSLSQVNKEKESLEGKLRTVERQRRLASEALANANEKLLRQRYLSTWRSFLARRRLETEKASQLSKQNEERQAYRCYLQWRLADALAQEKRQSDAASKATRCEMEELRGQIDVFKEQLAAERQRNAEMEERLKEAFLRGVSAVNREAVQALRGEPAENDVAAIEDILSKHGGSRRASNVSPLAENSVSGRSLDGTRHGAQPRPQASRTGSLQGVCPVHHVDAESNFYHRCYAPAVCDYGPAGGASTGEPRRTPFVVHGNLDAAATYRATPPIRSESSSKPKPARFRF